MADAVDAWRREIIQSKLPATRIPDQSPRHVAPTRRPDTSGLFFSCSWMRGPRAEYSKGTISLSVKCGCDRIPLVNVEMPFKPQSPLMRKR